MTNFYQMPSIPVVPSDHRYNNPSINPAYVGPYPYAPGNLPEVLRTRITEPESGSRFVLIPGGPRYPQPVFNFNPNGIPVEVIDDDFEDDNEWADGRCDDIRPECACCNPDYCHKDEEQGIPPKDVQIGLEKIYEKSCVAGFVTTDEGYIEPINKSTAWVGAFIPGMIIDDNVKYHDGDCCAMVNTIDKGFRFVGVENGKTVDLGPVDSACVVIGNIHKPSGVYIPLDDYMNASAGVKIAKEIVDKVVAKYSTDYITFESLPEEISQSDNSLDW